MICPACQSSRCYRSHRRGLLDFALTILDLRPWRCRECDRRFYGSKVAATFCYYAHCPVCGNFDLQGIGRDRIEDGTLIWLKRLLQFPAYRCAPCRRRFFSVLPFRRIVASDPQPGAGEAPAKPSAAVPDASSGNQA